MTKLLFRTALIELMQEKPFHKITIKEICDKADLNRTTFYLHYEDQSQLLDDIVLRLEEDTAEHFSNVTGKGDDIELLANHLEYVKENALTYRTLMSNNLNDGIREKIFRNMLSDMSERMPVIGTNHDSPYIHTFMLFGSGTMILQWIDNGFDLDTHYLASLVYNLCKASAERVRNS